ncbi:unnamed protein product, partial [Larinioides sclopetarius]
RSFKRARHITQRSVDRNHALLGFYFTRLFFFYYVLSERESRDFVGTVLNEYSLYLEDNSCTDKDNK